MNIRYVISYMDKDGARCMAYPMQGRNTRGSKEEAQTELEHFINNNREETLISIFGRQALGTFEVSAVECYDGHNDPKGCYIQKELNPDQVTVTGWLAECFKEEV